MLIPEGENRNLIVKHVKVARYAHHVCFCLLLGTSTAALGAAASVDANGPLAGKTEWRLTSPQPHVLAAPTETETFNTPALVIEPAEPVAVLPVPNPTVLTKPSTHASSNPWELEKNWTLHKNRLIHSELSRWAQDSGWQLVWGPSVSWETMSESHFRGSFEQAIADVVRTLYLEGRPVRLMLWKGNKVAEVVSNEVE